MLIGRMRFSINVHSLYSLFRTSVTVSWYVKWKSECMVDWLSDPEGVPSRYEHNIVLRLVVLVARYCGG